MNVQYKIPISSFKLPMWQTPLPVVDWCSLKLYKTFLTTVFAHARCCQAFKILDFLFKRFLSFYSLNPLSYFFITCIGS